MGKYKKIYVEKKYYNGQEFETVLDEVSERNPELIEDDGEMLAFRFFDVIFTTEEDKISKSRKMNYSSWILMGKKYSVDELERLYGHRRDYRRIIEVLRNKGVKYVCHNRNCGFTPVKEADMTYDELVNGKISKRK